MLTRINRYGRTVPAERTYDSLQWSHDNHGVRVAAINCPGKLVHCNQHATRRRFPDGSEVSCRRSFKKNTWIRLCFYKPGDRKTIDAIVIF